MFQRFIGYLALTMALWFIWSGDPGSIMMGVLLIFASVVILGTAPASVRVRKYLNKIKYQDYPGQKK